MPPQTSALHFVRLWPKGENGADCVVVAPPRAQIGRAGDACLAKVAEDVVNASKLGAGEYPVEPTANLDNGVRCRNRVEVANHEHGFVMLGAVLDELQQVVRCRRAFPLPTRAQRQRAMMVHEENRLIRLDILQADPHTCALAEVLPGLLLVVRYDTLALLEHFPEGFAPSDADVLVRVPRLKLLVHASVKEHVVRLLAFLETHEVVGHILCRLLDQLPGTASSSAHLVKELPPEEVEREHPHLGPLALCCSVVPDVGQWLFVGMALLTNALRQADPLAFALLAHLQAEFGGARAAFSLQSSLAVLIRLRAVGVVTPSTTPFWGPLVLLLVILGRLVLGRLVLGRLVLGRLILEDR
mmetsp:Transcript_24895/g.57865  ORF Transcript_24895/g.57865 Transcript_24895/m.57865 type:complete len:356 (+) Transcript_24895:325-1392(+)